MTHYVNPGQVLEIYTFNKTNNMNENEKVLANYMSRFMTGFSLSKAILEDYAKVIAKIEGSSEEEVKKRVQKRSEEIFLEAKKEAGSSRETENAQ